MPPGIKAGAGARYTIDRPSPFRAAWRSGWVRRGLPAVLVVAAVAGGVVVWLQGRGPVPVDPRARVYVDRDVCLLAGEGGIASGADAAVWASIQAVTTSAGVRSSYVAMSGRGTGHDVQAYVAGLVQQRCDVILYAGERTRAVAKEAAAFSEVTFFLVNAPAELGSANVRAVGTGGLEGELRSVLALPAG